MKEELPLSPPTIPRNRAISSVIGFILPTYSPLLSIYKTDRKSADISLACFVVSSI